MYTILEHHNTVVESYNYLVCLTEYLSSYEHTMTKSIMELNNEQTTGATAAKSTTNIVRLVEHHQINHHGTKYYSPSTPGREADEWDPSSGESPDDHNHSSERHQKTLYSLTMKRLSTN